MDLLAALNHLLNFFAPAAVLALLLVPGGRILVGKSPYALAWWVQAAINLVVCCAALLAALWFFGRDGKMLGYAALVLAGAGSQWLVLRGWHR